MISTEMKILKPSNDYDLAAWQEYWLLNPHERRSLSADAVDDSNVDDASEDTSDDAENSEEKSSDAKGVDDKKTKKQKSATDGELAKRYAKLEKERDEANKKATEALEAMKRYEGIDPDRARKVLAEVEKAEEEAKLARGEFEAVKKQMIERHEAEKKAMIDEMATIKGKLSATENLVEELTVGFNFSTSKFLNEKTVYTPKKARAIYGAHFDVVDGKVVGYDKPRGSEGRSPIVDSSGNPASFDEAIQKIVEDDEDRDRIMKATVTPGADSNQAKGKAKEETNDNARRGLGKISLALQKNRK